MATTRVGSKRLLRDINQNIVFNLIAEHGPISRTDLAKRSGLPAATITHIVGNFIAAGLVYEGASGESSGGRRPVSLSINASAGYVIGVKLRENSLTITVCDLNCSILYAREAVFMENAAPYQVIETISEEVKRCIQDANVPYKKVVGVGVGLSGLIDSARGLCHYSAILNWREVELGPALEFKLRLPVRVDNDVNTLAVAERYFGIGREAANFLLVTVGRGIGLGIVIRGEIYRGSYGGAGEFGHMTVDTSSDAPVCNCGKRGCLEAIVSDYGIIQAATGTPPGHDVEDKINVLVQQAHAGDETVRAIFVRAGYALGIAIANLINIFDPSCVVLAGEGLRAGDLLLGPMNETIPQHLFDSTSRTKIDVLVRPMDETYWARGAASLILHKVFQPPIYEETSALAIDDLLLQASNRPARRG